MLNLDALFDEDAKAARKPAVSGKWFEIRLTPDLVSGELLNIGVGFVRARTRSFHFRLLESGAPFGCLYGPEGRQQFGFLLSVVRESLTTHGPAAEISPQISFGEPRPASGESIEQILDDLYRSVVTLGRRLHQDDDKPTAAERNAPRSTETVRKRVRRAFATLDNKGFRKYWQDDPVTLRVDNVPHPVDLQLWQDEGLFSPRYFASIISTCYRDAHYRQAFLGVAYRALTAARTYGGNKARGACFILTPGGEEARFNPEMRTTIENEIDNATWILRKKFGITAVTDSCIDNIKQQALEFAS